MGLDRSIAFAAAQAPAWPAIAARMQAGGFMCEMRMIDGALAFPDEAPPEDWRELRLGTPHGMVTLRREPEGMKLVIWGNADAGLLADRDRIASVIAELAQA